MHTFAIISVLCLLATVSALVPSVKNVVQTRKIENFAELQSMKFSTNRMPLSLRSESPVTPASDSSVFKLENLPLIGLFFGILAFCFQLSVLYPWHLELHSNFEVLEVSRTALLSNCDYSSNVNFFGNCHLVDRGRFQRRRGEECGDTIERIDRRGQGSPQNDEVIK